jgi:hypothetical protein
VAGRPRPARGLPCARSQGAGSCARGPRWAAQGGGGGPRALVTPVPWRGSFLRSGRPWCPRSWPRCQVRAGREDPGRAREPAAHRRALLPTVGNLSCFYCFKVKRATQCLPIACHASERVCISHEVVLYASESPPRPLAGVPTPAGLCPLDCTVPVVAALPSSPSLPPSPPPLTPTLKLPPGQCGKNSQKSRIAKGGSTGCGTILQFQAVVAHQGHPLM